MRLGRVMGGDWSSDTGHPHCLGTPGTAQLTLYAPCHWTSFSRVMVEVEVRKCRLLVSRGAAPSKNKCQL